MFTHKQIRISDCPCLHELISSLTLLRLVVASEKVPRTLKSAFDLVKIKFAVISGVNVPVKTDCVLLATSTSKNKPFEVTVVGFAPLRLFAVLRLHPAAHWLAIFNHLK